MCEYHICRLRELRLRYGISQAELALAAGVSRQLITQIELEEERQSRGNEAMLRRAFTAVIASRQSQLAALEQELADIPWLFSFTEEESEHG